MVNSFKIKIILFILFFSHSSLASKYYLLVGGGPSINENEISIENNMKFVYGNIIKVVDKKYISLLFSDGKNPALDTYYLSKNNINSELYKWLTVIFTSFKSKLLSYKSNKIDFDNLKPAIKSNLRAELLRLSRVLTKNDSLVIYFVGHGGSHTNIFNENTSFYLWNNESIDVVELNNILSVFPKGVKIISIMSQCYSGGFSNIYLTITGEKFFLLVSVFILSLI